MFAEIAVRRALANPYIAPGRSHAISRKGCSETVREEDQLGDGCYSGITSARGHSRETVHQDSASRTDLADHHL
jgi:hypothetical protein